MEFWGGLGFVSLPLKRFYMYILKRLIGGFLRHDIDLEQLDVQLYRGIVQLKSLELDVAQLNMAILGGGLVFHFASAIIACIKMDIPWRHLLRDHFKVYVSGIDFIVSKGAPDAASPGPGWPNTTIPPAAVPPRFATGRAESPAHEIPGDGSHSDEGIETLSRLVKLIMSRMEVCIDEASLSLRSTTTEHLLRAKVDSVVVFSEEPSDDCHERAARVAGMSLAWVQPDVEPLFLVTTDPGMLRVRKGRRLAGGIIPGVGVKLDVELSLNAVRFVVALPTWRPLCKMLAELAQQEVTAEDASGEAESPVDSSGLYPASMVQSLMESSFAGNSSPMGFWHELYNLFEAESQLEDVAGIGDHSSSAVEEEINFEELAPLREGQAAQEGPVLGYIVQVSVGHVGGLLVLSDACQGSTPHPSAVPLVPGPATTVPSDQAQLCLSGCSATYERRPVAAAAVPHPAGNVLLKSISVHLHKRTGPPTDEAEDSQPPAAGLDMLSRATPEDALFFSEGAGDACIMCTPEPGSPDFSATESVEEEGSEDSFQSADECATVEAEEAEEAEEADDASPAADDDRSEVASCFQADEEGEEDDEQCGEDLKRLFFDRSRPMRELLQSRGYAIGEEPVEFEDSGGGASSSTSGAWRLAGPNFQSKQILYFHPLSAPGSAGGGCEHSPVLTLPPVGHPLWQGLRLVEGGQFASSGTVGHQLYADWSGVTAGDQPPSRPAVTVECQPLVLYLCADSLQLLSSGASWLGDIAAVPQGEQRPRPGATMNTRRLSFDRSAARRSSPSFALVSLMPLLRVEIDLGSTENGRVGLLGDFVIPRIFGVPQSDDGRPRSRESNYEECFRLDLADMKVFQVHKADSTGSCPSSVGSTHSSCTSLLSAVPATGRTAPHEARLSCSIFRRCSQASEAPSPNVFADPSPSDPQPGTLLSEGVSTLSEWTKISEMQSAGESRSSLVLQDLRHAFIRQSQPTGSRRGSSVPPKFRGGPMRHQEETLDDAGRSPSDQQADYGERVGEEAELELEVHVPGLLQLHTSTASCQLLLEAALQFLSQLQEEVLVEQELKDRLPLGCSIAVGSLCLRVDEEEVPGGSRELHFKLSPMSGRFLRAGPGHFKTCCACKDFRLEDRGPKPELPSALVLPWVQKLQASSSNSEAGASGGSTSSSSCPSGYPWEMRRSRVLLNTARSLFSDGNCGHWREANSLLFQLRRRRRAGQPHTAVAVKANCLLVNAHHRLQPAYSRLRAFVKALDQTVTAANKRSGEPTDWQVSLFDSLVDLPSEAFDSACLSSGSSAKDEGELWRVLLHLDGLDVSLKGQQVQHGKAKECNLFLVDQPSHLSRTEITSVFPEPVPHLLGLGFAKVLSITGSNAVWSRNKESGSSAPEQQSLQLSIGELTGRACADTVKCLLSVGMELMEKIPLAPWPHEQPGNTTEAQAEADVDSSEAAVSILEHIDMFAFAPGTPPPEEEQDFGSRGLPFAGSSLRLPSAESPLDSVLINDYIQAQEQQQSPRAPVCAQASSEGSDAAPPSAAAAVCLFDPEAFPEGQLRELCAQDQFARREVEMLLALQEEFLPSSDELPIPLETRQVPREAPGKGSQQEVLHRDGTSAVWLVDPDEVHVVADHFALVQGPQDESMMSLPGNASPVRFFFTLQCGSAGLSLHAGADFEGRVPGRSRDPTARHTNHLTLHLKQSVASLTLFDPLDLPKGGSTQLAPPCVLQRRLHFRAKDFSILDRVQSSVFSHLLAYFEDETRRPRSCHHHMLQLAVDQFGLGGESPEYAVELKVLPLQLTVDQDVVDFLLEFAQLCTMPNYVEEDHLETPGSRAGAREASVEPEPSSVPPAAALRDSAREPFFQQVSVGPLLLSVDYRAKRLDVSALRRGELWELVNLLPILEGLQIAFRSVKVSGVSGTNQLVAQVVSAWSADLNRTQILRSLTGVTPIRSFANIGGGFAEMVLEPLKQFRKGDPGQRVSRTLLRGLVSFLKHVTVEGIDLTERIFVGTQSALEYMSVCFQEHQQASISSGSRMANTEPEPVAESSGSPLQAWTAVERGASDFLQPGGAAEGLERACTSLTRGVRHAGEAAVLRPLLELHRGAPCDQVLRSVVSGIPMCVLQPAIGATAAATTALRGVRNSVDPSRRREAVQKYKGPE